jgi:hypothetical protein
MQSFQYSNVGGFDLGIPPDDYPVRQTGQSYSGTTSFDVQSGGANIRSAEIRGEAGEDIFSLSLAVIPPKGGRTLPITNIGFGVVNVSQPQIRVDIQTADGSPIPDGYQCHFSFQSVVRT